MITIEKFFPREETYPLARLGREEDLLFFDIETTGFSPDNAMVYLIGCICPEESRWHFIQWFADRREAEGEVLSAFLSFAGRFHTLVHFNGDTFDLPFLEKRLRKLRTIPEPPKSRYFETFESIDIYKRIRPWKKYLGLASMKQKSIETFLGIAREDRYGGGELIEVYRDYLYSRSEELLHLLLLHNEDDLKGMPALLPILYYPDFFTQEFTPSQIRRSALAPALKPDTGRTPDAAKKTAPGSPNLSSCSSRPGELILTLTGDPATKLPVPVGGSLPAYTVLAEENRLTLSLRLYEGTLKYFYPDYKNYYYLIFEDMAVHKSVGEYVDASARVRATKETCYTRRSGIFLPQPETIFTPEFKNSASEKSGFFEAGPDCFSDTEACNRYVGAVLRAVFH